MKEIFPVMYRKEHIHPQTKYSAHSEQNPTYSTLGKYNPNHRIYTVQYIFVPVFNLSRFGLTFYPDDV